VTPPLVASLCGCGASMSCQINPIGHSEMVPAGSVAHEASIPYGYTCQQLHV
jgi:hypothetical protein